MQTIWQLVDSAIIPIMTYGAEGWNPTKQEITKLEGILTASLRTILGVPKSTLTTILLAETGYFPIEYEIKKKEDHAGT